MRVIHRLSTGLARLVSSASHGFAEDVYSGFVPVTRDAGPRNSLDASDEADRFLEDLWRDAPIRVALATTLGALAVTLSPPLVLGRLTLFSRLSVEERESLLERLMTADSYLVRLLFYGVKSMALVAVLRDPASRRELGLDAEPPRP